MLDTTEALMLSEGYAAVSTRRVAAEAGLKAPLVHYYFPTTDDLLLACYKRAADASIERLAEVIESERPLRGLWRLSTDPSRTALALEFMALANHRKAVRAEIAKYAERLRAMQEGALASLGGRFHTSGTHLAPAGLAMILAGIARGLVLEEGLGVLAGHAEATAWIEAWIDEMEPPPISKAKGVHPD